MIMHCNYVPTLKCIVAVRKLYRHIEYMVDDAFLFLSGMRFRGTQAFHAWNSVLIHGHWRLIDCHWASRRMFGKKGTEHIRYLVLL